MLGVANHPVIESRANGQQHIAVLHGIVGLDGAVHAQHAQETGIGCGECTQTHEGVGDGATHQINQSTQFGRGLAHEHAATGVDVGALGRLQQLQGLADLSTMATTHGVVGPHFNVLRIAGVADLLERHVLGDVHHHRARTSRAGNVKRLFHGLSQVFDVLDQKVVFHDGARDAHGVALLEGIHANRRCGHLTRDDHHGDAVHVGRGNARDGIGYARTRGHQRHADITGGTRITIGGMHRGLFVSHQDVLNRVLLVDGVVDVEDGAAGIAPNVFHALSL